MASRYLDDVRQGLQEVDEARVAVVGHPALAPEICVQIQQKFRYNSLKTKERVGGAGGRAGGYRYGGGRRG